MTLQEFDRHKLKKPHLYKLGREWACRIVYRALARRGRSESWEAASLTCIATTPGLAYCFTIDKAELRPTKY